MIGKEIKALRKKYGWTQEQLADKVGVHRVTVAGWEAGTRRMSQMAKRSLERLARDA